MSNGASSTQQFVKYVPLAGSLVGMVLILGSIVFFFDSGTGRVIGAAGGIMALLGAVWYAANPFFKSTRRYVLLRAEIVRFINIARELNAAVVQGAPADRIEDARSLMHEAVERIIAAAGKTEVPGRESEAITLVRSARP